MANPGDEMSSNVNPPPNQNDVPEEPEVNQPAARPRRTRLNLGLHLGTPGSGAGPSSARPPRMIIWPHLAARVTPPPPPPPRRRPLPPLRPLSPTLTAMMADLPWKCPICRTGFFNMRSLCGHMRVHKDRNWRGIYPPAELCEPLPQPGPRLPQPGLRLPQSEQSLGAPQLGLGLPQQSLGVPQLGLGLLLANSPFGGTGSGGTASGVMQAGPAPSALVPCVPVQNLSADGAPSALVPSVPLQNLSADGTPGGRERDREEELRLARLGKRHAPAEEETSLASKRSKRTQEGQVPDLNDSPPSSHDDHQEGEEEGGAEGTSACDERDV